MMTLFDYVNILKHLKDDPKNTQTEPYLSKVACWANDGRCYNIGDTVPPLRRYRNHTYSVMLTEGGHINITNNVIESFTLRPESRLIFDKFGNAR